jgi:phosphate uptake regulator
MYIRGIQKTGGSSYILTLPKEWVSAHGLQDKHKVILHIQQSGQLVVLPESVTRLPLVKRIMADRMSDREFLRMLTGYYIAGVDEIIICSSRFSASKRTIIRNINQRYIGFELSHVTTTMITIKNILPTIPSPISHVLQMADMAHMMYHNLLEAITSKDISLLEEVIESDQDVDRIHLLLLRQFNALLHQTLIDQNTEITLIDSHYCAHIAIRIERLADHLVKIARSIHCLGTSKIQLQKNIVRELISLGKAFKLLHPLIQELDIAVAHKILNYYEESRRRLINQKQLRAVRGFEVVINDSIERTRSYMSNIAEEIINYASSKEVEKGRWANLPPA